MTTVERARLCLDGLSVGDAFGERFFGPAPEVVRRILAREVPAPPWRYTDDTEMAISVLEILEAQAHGEVDQDVLPRRFADRMDPRRGYGAGTHAILTGIREGRAWRPLSRGGFNGMGSFGNGAAMRVGPLGAFFAEEDLATVVEQARLSAEPTHAHAEGIAGAVAVAVGCALAWRSRRTRGPLGPRWIDDVNKHVPSGYTHDAIAEAITLDGNTGIVDAAKTLGNGSGVTAPDTVPLCLWVAAHRDSFDDALWTVVGALGDRDTTCAIVGSILALRVGRRGIPGNWLRAREPLQLSGGGAPRRAGT